MWIAERRLQRSVSPSVRLCSGEEPMSRSGAPAKRESSRSGRPPSRRTRGWRHRSRIRASERRRIGARRRRQIASQDAAPLSLRAPSRPRFRSTRSWRFRLPRKTGSRKADLRLVSFQHSARDRHCGLRRGTGCGSRGKTRAVSGIEIAVPGAKPAEGRVPAKAYMPRSVLPEGSVSTSGPGSPLGPVGPGAPFSSRLVLALSLGASA